MTNDFYSRVYKLVKKIPKGKVATYGQVAALLGQPRAAQAVGWALRVCPDSVPWPRVVNKAGMISITNPRFPKSLQADLLKKDGVKVIFKDGNFFIDLKKYLWHK